MYHYFLILWCLFYPQTESLSLLEEREDEFSFIKDYELIHFNLASLQTENILEFDAYGQHYVIKLTPNDKVSPMVNHQKSDNVVSTKHTARHSQCHFHGKVMNYNGQSVVSLSLCENRGIRGMIRAFGDTLYVYPSAYYLDIQNTKSYQPTDEHLVYKASNYDEHKASLQWGPIEGAVHDKLQKATSSASSGPENDRRRLAYNHGQNVVEMFILADQTFVTVFKEEYGDDWYQELYHYLAEVVSLATAEYEAGEWNKYADIGTLTIKWVELDIVEYWSGDYRALKCSPCSYDDRDGRGAYLRKFRDWSLAYKDVNNFDFGIIYSREESVMSGGIAWICGMCDDSLKYAVAASPGNMSRQRKLNAHELGHSLCMMHDENEAHKYPYTCPGGSIMGTEDWNKGWSDCSYEYVRDFFQNYNTDCLMSRDNDFVVDGYQTKMPTMSPTPKPTGKPTPSPTRYPTITGYNTTAILTTEPATLEPTEFASTAGGYNPRCVHLTALGEELNGEWLQVDHMNGFPVYQKGEMYFYVIPDYNIPLSGGNGGGGGSSSDSGEGTGYDNDGNYTEEAGSSSDSAGGDGEEEEEENEYEGEYEGEGEEEAEYEGDGQEDEEDGGDGQEDEEYEGEEEEEYEGDGEEEEEYEGEGDGEYEGTGYDGDGNYTDYGAGGSSSSDSGDGTDYDEDAQYAMFWTMSKVPGQITWDYGYCRLGNIGDLTHCDYNWINGEGKRDTNGMFDPCNALENDPEQAPCILNNPYDRTMCFYQQTNNILLDVSVDEGCLNEHAVYKYSQQSTDGNNTRSKYFLTNNGRGKWVISINAISNFGEFFCEEKNLSHCTDGKWKQWISDDDLEYAAVAHGVNIVGCSVHDADQRDLAQRREDEMTEVMEEIGIGVSVIGILGCIGLAVFYCRRNKHMDKQIKFNELRELELDQELPSTLDVDTEAQPMYTYH